MNRKEVFQVRDLAYNSIKKMILSNEIMPGESLSENKLAQEIGISRTPIREAIFVLEAEGFINTIPNRGSVVVKFDVRDIVEFMQVREGLEGIATKLAAEKIKGEEQVFYDLLERLSFVSGLKSKEEIDNALSIGRQLHDEILNLADNRKLSKMVDNLYSQLDRIMLLSRNAEKRIEISHGEHIEIVKAILKGDSGTAEKLMHNHIIGATNDAIKAYQQHYR